MLTLRRSRDAYSSIVSAASCLPCRRYRAARLRSVVVTVGLTITDTLFACTVHQLNAHISAANLIQGHTHTHNRFTALFPGPPGWASTRRELLDIMVQGKINRGRHTNHLAGRHSILTNQCPSPPFPPFFYRLDALRAAQSTVSKHWRQLAHSDYGEDARVLLNGVTCTVSVSWLRIIC